MLEESREGALSAQRWWVLLGLMLLYAVSNGIVIVTLPLLYPEFIDEFGWSAATVTLPGTIFFVVSAITTPPAGVMLDRFSPRIMILAGSLLMVGALVACTFVVELWQMVACFVAFGLSLSLCGLTANMVVLTRWFSKEKGRATGLLLMSSSLGGTLFPLLLGAVIATAGWRAAMMNLAIIAALVMLPAVLFLVRDRPPANADSARAAQPVVARPITGPTLSVALRTPAFYVIVFATGAVWFSVVALLQHQAIFLATDVGLERSRLPSLFSLFFFSAVFGKFAFGLLGDYQDKEITMAFSIATLVIGLILLLRITAADASSPYIYAVVAGLGFSGAFTTIQVLIAEYFAGSSYGIILGLLVMIDSLAGGLGSYVVGQVRESTGSYVPAIQLMMGLCIAAIAAVILLRWRRLSAARILEETA